VRIEDLVACEVCDRDPEQCLGDETRWHVIQLASSDGDRPASMPRATGIGDLCSCSRR
jgi:hypothetical protein